MFPACATVSGRDLESRITLTRTYRRRSCSLPFSVQVGSSNLFIGLKIDTKSYRAGLGELSLYDMAIIRALRFGGYVRIHKPSTSTVSNPRGGSGNKLAPSRLPSDDHNISKPKLHVLSACRNSKRIPVSDTPSRLLIEMHCARGRLTPDRPISLVFVLTAV